MAPSGRVLAGKGCECVTQASLPVQVLGRGPRGRAPCSPGGQSGADRVARATVGTRSTSSALQPEAA